MKMLAGLVPLFFIWAALHDISRGGEDFTFEYVALALGVAGMAALFLTVFRRLSLRAQAVTLWASAGVLLFLDLSALSAALAPKYVNDAAVGGWFLLAGLPLLAFLAYRLRRAFGH